ncbi:GHKL domain-containing protein [Thiorhodococcus mannitoliphagus]|uniref:histidine kinase n=1 Tax=Thiorhodococcus mannitoliphagus TaxID=329406 RepID=A0A6P1DNJ2_9GAMM|nr:ATP-binding protein [Thiorhodococcus mannitoliphagus]NEX19807.1 GHKL domain-containing protein [Thiorhodococcus mannitoliphagus]
MRSLRARVLLSAAAVLTLFVLLTALALERAVRDAVIAAREERLQAQIFLLMAVGEEDQGGLVFPNALAEPRLTLPNSGLYAEVLSALGDPVWRSPSALGLETPAPLPLPPGQRRFARLSAPDGKQYLVLAFGVTWATGAVPQDYSFVVAEEAAAAEREVVQFRTSLATWLGAMTLLMLVALVLVLRWGLRPLRQVTEELATIESGRQAQIIGRYPREIETLTDRLNALLAHERARQRRLDNTLGDLAHSLKTPLAVMQGALEEGEIARSTQGPLQEQLERMHHIVDYQLQRARTSGQGSMTLAPPVPVGAVAKRLIASLEKVHRDKGVAVAMRIDDGLLFRGVEGDLMEMLGNLLENAFKWCHGQIRLESRREPSQWSLCIEDDGPGIPEGQVSRLLERGARADESTPGYGIGLAVVREISAAYGGRLEIDRSTLGGARVRLSLPR